VTNGLVQSSVMGVMCTFIGILVGATFMDSPGEGWRALPLLAGLSAFASGTLCWWVFVARRRQSNVWRGVLAGVAAALIAHYGTFYLMIVKGNIAYWTYGTVSSLGEPPIGLVDGIVGAAPFTFFSYLFVGWFTIPAGAAIGGLYARYVNKG
jgi:hypothetical protein